ncbi:Fc.00g060540.m01.CDS01 [Cosmosporella sp. VM-42]
MSGRISRLVSRTRSEEGQETGKFPASTSEKSDGAYLNPSLSSKTNVPLELSNPIPSIVVREPEETQQVCSIPDTGSGQVECAQQRPGLHRAIAEPSGISSGFLKSRLECLSIADETEQIIVPGSGRADTEACGGEVLSVPDVEFSDDSDSEEGYWEWDQEEEQFRHWDAATQTWVYCPDEFD